MLTDYRREIEIAGKTHGINADLLEALVIQESAGRADAFRFEPGYFARYLAHRPDYKGAIPRRVSSSYGLCQIMYPTAVQHGFRAEPEMLFLPGLNLDLGAKILSHLITRLGGDIEAGLQAYNGGPGNVGTPLTIVYSRSVLGHLEAIRRERRA